MTDADPIDRQLLDRWRSGDESARDRLLAAVLPWLHAEMRLALGADPRASRDSLDLAQAAVTSFLTRGPRFVPETPAQFRSLLKRIAKNELIDQWRRRKRAGGCRHLESLLDSAHPLSGFAPAPGTAASPVEDAAAAEQREWVRLALQFLAEEDRWLLLASEVDGLSWSAVAEELELPSADAARMRAKRLKPRLANVLRRLRDGRMPATE